MSRMKNAEPILKAAEQWRDQCLLGGGSILSKNRLWTRENFGDLHRHYVKNLDAGEGTFFQKLKAQLQSSPAGAKQLASEILWVIYLVVSNRSMSDETKRFQIRDVWEWSGETLDSDQWAMQEPLENGIVNPGTAYHTHRWREFLFFVTTMIDWTELSAEEKKALLGDPWELSRWLGEREHSKGRQLRHALLYLLFPDDYECILSSSHKKDIAKRFNSQWSESPDVDYGDQIAVDQALLAVRERVEADSTDDEVNFYREPHRSFWQKHVAEGSPEEESTRTSLPEAKKWFKERFGNVKVWVLSAGEGARLWLGFQRDGVAAIGWDELGDFAQYESKESVRNALILGGQTNPVMDTKAVWQFAQKVKTGDIILIKKGRSKLLGWGIVQDECEYDPERPEFHHVLKVEWKSTQSVNLPRDRWVTNKTLTDFSRRKEWVFFAFSLIDGSDPRIVRGSSKTPRSVATSDTPYSVTEALRDLFLPPELFTRILDAMTLRKNLILQGPPGVGKTFIAKRIAWSIIGRKAPDCVEMVQFHQSYSYEDFVQGWRPTEAGGFTLRNGVFYEFCSRAASNRDTPHVFIIDEINRGNLSRIFGELLMLIEADKRGEEHTIPLTYSALGERFSVPENVFVLGMMNTADRSLAMVDYALRRRFGFVALEPAFGSEPFQQYLLDAGADPSVVKLIDERMSSLNEKIRKDSKNLGAGFEIGHSYFVPSDDDESLDENWFRNIVHTQIEPLLREYWFDQPEKVQDLISDLLH